MADARARTAASLRRLGHALVAHDVPEDLLARIAEVATGLAEEVERTPPRQRDLVALKRRMFEVPVVDGGRVSHFDECVVSGAWNPMGTAIEVHRDGDEMVARVALGPAFEGAPGRAHGGVVAAIFDDIMGYVLTLLGQPAFTGELHVRFLAPTPIGQPLEFRARLDRREGRKLYISATATADGRMVGEASAVFVAVDPERIRP